MSEITKKLLITDNMIDQIKDFAHSHFNNERDLSRFGTKEMQIFLILHGLERFLMKNGVEPGFELAVLPIEDSLPVDESGLGEILEEVETQQ